MKKQIFSCLLVFAMILGLNGTALAVETPFSDVSPDAPYAEAVAWCYENGILNGVSATSFDPNGTLTRAMLATALYRAEKEPAVSSAPSFSDTQPGVWYSNAVVWSNSNGLLHGYGNGFFGTDDPVSAEQLEVVVGRYNGNDPEWAGDPAKAHPATRAEVATALYALRTEGNTETPPPAAESSKTMIIYFSRTNNTKGIVEKVQAVTDADTFEIIPEIAYTDADINYNDNTCRANREQNDPSARPAITGTLPDLSEYDVIFLGYPIWHGQAPKVIYTFLENCEGLSGQTVIPFCTSASSPVGSSATNLHSLVPSTVNWMDGRRFNSGASQSDVTAWVDGLNLNMSQDTTTNSNEEEPTMNKITLTFNGHSYTATLADNSSAEALKTILADRPLTINMSDYGNMEKVGPIGQSLPTNNEQINTQAGDLILYQGSNLVIYYSTNSWNFTRLGRIDDSSGLRDALGSGNVSVTLTLG